MSTAALRIGIVMPLAEQRGGAELALLHFLAGLPPSRRAQVPLCFLEDGPLVPWATDAGYVGRMTDRSVSFLKNRWVAVTGPGGTCYAQVEDTGPGRHDAGYVFGTARPQGVGMAVSPAVARCVGMAPAATALLDWTFVETPQAGPWADLITTRQVS